jgi:hypothetical protein
MGGCGFAPRTRESWLLVLGRSLYHLKRLHVLAFAGENFAKLFGQGKLMRLGLFNGIF